MLLATLEPGDEVLMMDPIYVGLINRVRLAGGVPRFVPWYLPLRGGDWTLMLWPRSTLNQFEQRL